MKKLTFCIVFALIIHLFLFMGQAYATGDSFLSEHDLSIFQQLQNGQRILQERVHKVPDQPTVYLTFDDGPSELTSQVLDILKEEEISATFFVLGKLAERNPELIRRMVEEGHTIGNHTYNHDYEELYEHFAGFWEQLQRTEDILESLIGERPRIVRAPGGTYRNFDPFYFYYLDQAGYQVYDWNIDSGDSRARDVSAKQIIETVKEGPFPHEVHVLLHDGAGHASSVEALPQIIRFFKNKGYQFQSITPEVKPILFSVGDSKWERKMTMKEHEQHLQVVLDHTMENQMVYQAKEAVALSLKAKEHMVSFSEQKMTSNGEKNNRLLPVRSIVEGLKGRIVWSFKSRTAISLFIGGWMEWDPERKRVSVHADRYHFQIELPDLELTDDRLTFSKAGLVYMILKMLSVQ